MWGTVWIKPREKTKWISKTFLTASWLTHANRGDGATVRPHVHTTGITLIDNPVVT